jgi:cytochrome c553
VGDAVLGKAIWDEKLCSHCHGQFDSAAVTSGPASEPFLTPSSAFEFVFDAKLFAKFPNEILANYIYLEMPLARTLSNNFRPDPIRDCDQVCASHVAAYILDLGREAVAAELSAQEDYGAQVYSEYGCAGCHGTDGSNSNLPIDFDKYTLETLTQIIHLTMPVSLTNPLAWQTCIDECARAVAEYLWDRRPTAVCDAGERTLPRRVRKLTKFEYVNTINDLFGRTDAEMLARDISAEIAVAGFDNNVNANSINGTQMDGYWKAAEAVAAASQIDEWLTGEACTQLSVGQCFVTQFGRLAFRRPLTEVELTRYLDIFTSGSNDEEGARHVVHGMLISPNFLYRSEIGSGGLLTQYEVASLLSYTFWSSLPDPALLNQAAANGLSNPANISAMVDQMIADPRARRQFVHFGRQWLGVKALTQIDRDPQLFPDFTAEVAQAMDQELEAFLAEMLLNEGHTIEDFFTWDQTFANDVLGNYYGISGAGSQLAPVAAGPERGGVLHLGALLTRYAKQNETHPVARGLLVRRNLLCQEFGPPPPDAGDLPPPNPAVSTPSMRERFAAHSQNPTCASCHQYIDPVGFAFEHYDAVGRYRSVDANGELVDASGAISGLQRINGPDQYDFMNLAGLSRALAEGATQSTGACLIGQFQKMMDGEATPDACAQSKTLLRWNPAEQTLKDLWVEMVAAQTFVERK